ncbi:MAG TPA: hypothetical protein VEL31_10370 [Ktedonobacteraceae bacterium]|nr:hypothetical protein [Ktedonobacteraceae bacterium]
MSYRGREVRDLLERLEGKLSRAVLRGPRGSNAYSATRLLALERIYHPSFPELNLRQWTGSIYTWLTHPLLDPQKRGRVIMDHLMQLVTTALEWSYAEGEKDVNPKHLKAAAEHLTLLRDAIRVIDAQGQKEEEKDRKQEPPEEPHEPPPK